MNKEIHFISFKISNKMNYPPIDVCRGQAHGTAGNNNFIPLIFAPKN